MPWWIWVLSGFFLLALELLTSGIHLGFFGIGALLVGLMVALGWSGPLWMQLLLFSVISSVLLIALRQPLLRKLREGTSKHEVDAVVGQTALALTEIAPDAFGRAELRGSSWNARNVGSVLIANGQRCVVDKVDGLTLWVKSE